MGKISVEFFEVGREKKRFTATLSEIDHDEMYKVVRRSGALMSRDISFSQNPDTNTGIIHAGMHTVGKWRGLPETVESTLVAGKVSRPATPGPSLDASTNALATDVAGGGQ